MISTQRNQLMIVSMIFVGNFLLQAMEMKRSHDEFMRSAVDQRASGSVNVVAHNSLLQGPAATVTTYGSMDLALPRLRQADKEKEDKAHEVAGGPAVPVAAAGLVAMPLSVGDGGKREKEEQEFVLLSLVDLARVSPAMQADVEYKLGHCYYLGRGVQQDYKQAFAWLSLVDLTKVSPAVKADIRYKLGNCYYCGHGIKQDYQQACYQWFLVDLKRLLPAIQADIRYKLGNCYYCGQGVKQDYKQAFTWWSLIDFTQVSPAIQADIQHKLSKQNKQNKSCVIL